MTREEALNRARSVELDLVEIASTAKPPVVKIIDFKKFKYEESKREKETKKKTKEVDTKEIWLGPLISEHDLIVRTEQARKFLKSGDRVKFTIKFAGRELAHPELGFKVLDKALIKLADIGEKDSEPKWFGRALILSLKPIRLGNKANETKNKENNKKAV